MPAPLAVVILATGMLVGLWTSAGHGQDSTSEGTERSTQAGVYTENQARQGEATYRKYCVECHTPRTVSGRAFRTVWAGRTVYDFFELLRSTMPEDEPGKLSRDQYAEVIAYLLRLSGMPPGEQPLPGDEDALMRIRIDTASVAR